MYNNSTTRGNTSKLFKNRNRINRRTCNLKCNNWSVVQVIECDDSSESGECGSSSTGPENGDKLLPYYI
eukprot:TRINITY_DN2798_c2_g1_i1.p1 TRINITY_DN2798_c2_g1~~TRINITY_DN2798_c2_g1_i1.p1  ORF type:complete len:69 (+),score=4.39 TRINITY_DN2798_c2_g1_i1:151-357(+)